MNQGKSGGQAGGEKTWDGSRTGGGNEQDKRTNKSLQHYGTVHMFRVLVHDGNEK